MTTYDLYLESGPRRRKTMIHVPSLLGCVATGATTDEAIAHTPETIRSFLRLLARLGEDVDPDTAFTTRVVEHVTEGQWLGNGSPYLLFTPDRVPLGDDAIEAALHRFDGFDLYWRDWLAGQRDTDLDAAPAGGGRPGRAVVMHVLGARGSYLAAALGSAPGFGRVHSAVERGDVELIPAFAQSRDLIRARVESTTPSERTGVRELPAGPRTLHQALRRMLEHEWEHLLELSRRPGGPQL
jgi:predicted RNase H-like HicB family nuclease